MKFITYRDINRGLQIVRKELARLKEARATVGNQLKHALIADDMRGAAILAQSFSDLHSYVTNMENELAYQNYPE